MSKKVIKVPFSQEGLERAAKFLEDYEKQLKRNVAALLNRMIRTGEQYAINQVGHIDTGATISSIHGYRDGDKGFIVAGGNAIWIEFGTGVFFNGSTDNVHEKRSELGISDWGTFGDGHGANVNGWFYKGEDGEIHHTQGIEMQPFMYNTLKELARQAPEWAKEIFNK